MGHQPTGVITGPRDVLEDALGIRFELEGDVLTVRFKYAADETWIPAPDGYPLDGSRDFIEYRGRIFVPVPEHLER